METKQFIKLSKEGENSQIEYKTCYDQISYSLYESICSFLNHNGGYVLIGVNDKGKIIGVNPDKIQELKNNIISTVKNKDLFLPSLYLTPEIIEIEDKVVMALNVPCGQCLHCQIVMTIVVLYAAISSMYIMNYRNLLKDIYRISSICQ